MSDSLQAGAAVREITPRDSQFLYGYPHVERFSTGVHDPLLASALYLGGGREHLLFIANDIIFIPRALADRARGRIAAAAPIPAANIMITATHTHSGPKTVDYVSNDADPAVPPADPAYLALMEDRIVEAGLAAWRAAEPAEAGLAVADGRGIGTNRRDPAGPADPAVPVLMVRARAGGRPLACMVVCSMHPTVLHEDSTLVSGDFPAFARQYLQANVLGADCPVLYHTGPAGNQSPRHSVAENTFAAAEQLGSRLGRAIAEAIPAVEYSASLTLAARREFVELVPRSFPSVEAADAGLDAAWRRLESLRAGAASRQLVRTAECDWFGAEETLTLARAAGDGRLERARAECMPAEVQVFTVGRWRFAGWPGEIFVEYALALKSAAPDAFVISLANAELQGYIVTEEAAAEGGYEASNALFAPASGRLLVEATKRLIETGI